MKRLILAVPISVLLHLALALIMRPDYRDVSDFAVNFQVSEYMPGKPKKGTPGQKPEPEPVPEKKVEPEEKPAPKASPSKRTDSPPAIVKKETPTATETDKTPVEAEGAPTGADAGVGSGICMHDLFAFRDTSPKWLLYVSMASFRDTIFQKEFGNTFRSFDLGRRLTRYMGMNPAEEVEALFVSSEDIFDWRSFRIVASYDSGEERLKARMAETLKNNPNFKWQEKNGGFEAAIPGEFKWELMGSGRVFSVAYAAPLPPSGIAPKALPDNPFAASQQDAGAGDAKQEETASDAPSWPKQVPCITAPDTSKPSSKLTDIISLAKRMMSPDSEGHFPVAILSTSDPVAVGIGRRLGNRLGFKHAVVRGYFTDPVKIEGTLTFEKDANAVKALATGWADEAKQYASDPILALAGVSHLLRNLKIDTDGTTITFYLTMQERQVLSTLLFLQLQGKALERQLKSNR